MSPTDSKPVVSPPVARREPTVTHWHGFELEDDYGWLVHREADEVLDHLRAENRYTEEMMAEAEPLRDELYQEMLGRVREQDSSAPVKIDDWSYFHRTEKDRQYRIYCRRPLGQETGEEILLDVNELGRDREYIRLGALAVSPDHRLLAYSTDEDGSERFVLRILDLETREHLEEVIPNTASRVVWSNDSRILYYTTLDESRRPFRSLRHVLGTDPEADEEVFQEPDGRFFLSLFKTRSRRFLGILLRSHTTTEIHLCDTEADAEAWSCVVPRRQDVQVYTEHGGDYLYFLTDEDAPNSRLFRAPVKSPGREHWEELVPHRDDVHLEGVHLFARHLVLSLRIEGRLNLQVQSLESGDWHDLEHEEEVFTVHFDSNPEYESSRLRFTYSSLLQPNTVVEHDMDTRERTVLKEEWVGGGFRSEHYASERLWVEARDGARIPVSLVARRPEEGADPGPRPLLLYGYGAYGATIDPTFSHTRLSLLDRGVGFAIAHVRGGSAMGRAWYESGKLAHKPRTFTDFIDVADALVARGYTTPQQLAIRGGSAGGLLIGAVLNLRPELFRAALAEVPFVDVLNTMLDPDLPLTVIEYEEWGNPRETGWFERIRAYSPYDNVRPAAYPHLLVTAGLHDPRVQYWEPAKWVAKLRRLSTGDRLLLLKTAMGSGHSGASGRYDALREEAFKQAFLLRCL